MFVKTGLKSGENVESATVGSPGGESILSSPFINKWQTCYKCKGLKDQYGNVSNATCNVCWPMGSQAPV
jgi:hypothetical protein